jgi:2-keto-4-pentenoate hydratase
MDEKTQRELAAHLALLRQEKRAQSGLEQRLVPPNEATAYRVAGLVAEELGWKTGGWKIAATKEAMQRALRTDQPIYGRVFAQFIFESPATFEYRKLVNPIPEVEYAVRLGADLPPRTKAYSEDEVAAAVASLHPGLEIAECRFLHDEAFPALPAILADGAGSGSIIYGPAIADWRGADITGQEATLSIGGVVRRRGTAKDALEHPIQPLTWLANELSRTGIGLKAGDMVSTGTLTGMIASSAGHDYLGDFGPFGQVRATFTN